MICKIYEFCLNLLILKKGAVVQLVRTLDCHSRGREFESRRFRRGKKTAIIGGFLIYAIFYLHS